MTLANRLNLAITTLIAVEEPALKGTKSSDGSLMMWAFAEKEGQVLGITPIQTLGDDGIPTYGVRFGWHKDGAWITAPEQEMTLDEFGDALMGMMAQGAVLKNPDQISFTPAENAEITARALETKGHAEAEVRSDDLEVVVQIDARPYLARASEDTLLALWAHDWRGGYPGDQVQEAAEKRGDPAAGRITAYTDGSAGEIGFEVICDEEMMMDWLREFRPDAHAAVMVKEFQSKHDLPETGVLDELVYDAAEKTASCQNNEGTGDRDEETHEAAAEIAGKVNNEGSEAQIRFLVLQGYTLNDIDLEIENHDPGFY